MKKLSAVTFEIRAATSCGPTTLLTVAMTTGLVKACSNVTVTPVWLIDTRPVSAITTPEASPGITPAPAPA